MTNQTVSQDSNVPAQKPQNNPQAAGVYGCLGCGGFFALLFLIVFIIAIVSPKTEDRVDKLLEKYAVAQQQNDEATKKKIRDDVSDLIKTACNRAFEEFREKPAYKNVCEKHIGKGSSLWNWYLASCTINSKNQTITVQARTEIDDKKIQIMIRRDSDRTYHVFDVMVDGKQFWHERTGFHY